MPSQLIACLTVGISLCAIYGVLGILVSTIQELLTSWSSVRQSALDLRLRSLLADAARSSRLDALSCRRRAWILLGWGRAPKNTASPLYLALQKTGVLPESFTDRQPAYVDSENFARALVGAIRLVYPGAQGATLMDQLRTIIREQARPQKASSGANHSPEWVWNALDALISQAGDDIDLFKKHVEEWFDLSMDRLNGIYTRYSRLFLIFMGLIIAVAWNINSIDIARSLLNNAANRDAVIQPVMIRIASRCCPIKQPQPGTTQQNTGEARDTCANVDMDAAKDCIKQTDDMLADLNIPIGRPVNKTFCKKGDKCCDETYWKWFFQGYFWRSLIGWGITAVAVSLGSSFWFDMLNSLINIRLTGARPLSTLEGDTGAKRTKRVK